MTRVGIVGSGFIAAEHIPRWRHLGAELHLYGGRNAGVLAEKTGATLHSSLESLLAAVDVVDVCVPTHAHAEVAVAAAEAGRHVICEKPLAGGIEEARRIERACAEAGVRLFVGHVVRYFPEYEEIGRSVADGEVGDVAVIRLARESSRPQRELPSWLFDETLSGGVIGDLMVHDIDIARWLAGEVVRVHARTASSADDGVADHAFVVLTHASGAISHLTASWAMTAGVFRTRVEVAGSAGMLDYDSERTEPLALRFSEGAGAQSTGLPSLMGSGDDDPFVRQFSDFLAALGSGAPSASTVEDAMAALQVALAAGESARTGAAIDVKEVSR
ncbi:MAG: Gfo/Idh/MocA family oxidoreductase [Microbacterium sp.]